MASNSPVSEASATPAPAPSLPANGPSAPSPSLPAHGQPGSASPVAAAPTPTAPAATSGLAPRRGRPPSRLRPPMQHKNYNTSSSPAPAMPARQGSMSFAQPQQTASYGERGVLRPPDPRLPRHAGIVGPPQIASPAMPTPSTMAPPPDDPRGGISLPSPGPDHSIANPKFRDDYFRIFFAIQQSLPESARAAVREHWQKVLLGSVFNQGFILNAMVCNVEPDVARQSMKDFGWRLIGVAKNELMAHLTTADIDSLTDMILAKASDRFLDAALEKRLPTIDAKPLINALARAARLGYEPDDIEDDSTETSTAASAAPPASAAAPTTLPPAPAAAPTNAPPPAQPTKRQCNRCNRLFTKEIPFQYHVAQQLCWQMAPPHQGFKYACQECGQGFIDAHGQIYHDKFRICTTTAESRQKAATATASQPAAKVHRVGSPTPTRPNPRPIYVEAADAAASAYSSAAKAAEAYKRGVVEEPAVQTPARQQTPVPSSQPSAGQTTPLTIARKNHSEAYAHLSEKKLEELNQELLGVEQAFAPRFQEAELIDDPNERMQRLEGLRNSFGTRQSIVRKKYGVRLRERRTKAEILAEKERMGIAVKPHGNTVYVTKRVRSGDYNRRRSMSSDMDDTEDEHKRKMRPYAYSPRTGGILYPDSKYVVPSDSRRSGGPFTIIRGTGSTSDGPAATAVGDDNMSDSSSDDDDIPALLPDDVRQSLSSR